MFYPGVYGRKTQAYIHHTTTPNSLANKGRRCIPSIPLQWWGHSTLGIEFSHFMVFASSSPLTTQKHEPAG